MKILVSTDLSESSIPALELAHTMATAFKGTVELVHVLDSDLAISLLPSSEIDPVKQREAMLDQAQEALQELSGDRHPEVFTRCHTRVGVPHNEIVGQAQDISADLIVMASHGRTGLEHLLMGSVAERVVRGSHCAVLTIRTGGHAALGIDAGDVPGAPTHAPRKILAATDLTEASIPALLQADRLANAFGAELYLLHVIDIAYAAVPMLTGVHEGGELQQRMLIKAGEALREFVRAREGMFSNKLMDAADLLRMGEAAREIVLASNEVQADLIVMGRHGYHGFRRWLMGSVAEQVVRRAVCPVMTIPTSE